ncbi:MAG: hypothetical protein KAX13_07625 [Candidatus Krumholzibacteria bacterium]|nr:hypothetical protein [Candidatus Krumholzibacteria bacterium]
MFKGKVLLFSLLIVFATSVYAGEVDDCLSSAGIFCDVYADTLEFSICPAGDFEFIRNACGGTAAHIWVEVLNGSGNGIEGIPWTDFWLNACDPAQELCLCASAIAADSLTNAGGRTTISGQVAGGGCVLSGGMYIAVQGKVLYQAPDCIDLICLPIVITSPDNSGDCQVTITDFSTFAKSYNKGPGGYQYSKCCDYTNDDLVGLSDFSFFAKHYQHTCF